MAFLTIPLTIRSRQLKFRCPQSSNFPLCIPRATALPPLPKPPTQNPTKTSRIEASPPKPSQSQPRLSNIQVCLEKLNDTFIDASVHCSRLCRQQPVTTGPRVVILGTGWAAYSLVKELDYRTVSSLTVISPRNFFFFTPLLSATAVGTVEFRSILEPIRNANPNIDYFEAFATDVDTDTRHVLCTSRQRDGYDAGEQFRVPYDVLVVAVGETTTTFGVPGARKYAYFLKEISDARVLRQKILDSLEKAALPIYTDEERRRILHFVVCGGGPTGCEFAGELSDFVSNDLAPRYGKEFVSQIRVTLLQSGKSLLTQFEESLQDLALEDFRDRVNIMLNARVSEVTEHHVILQNGEKIPYGMLIWAAGNGTRPIVGKLVERATGEPQDVAVAKRRKIPVDGWLRVKGLEHVFAVGDCAIVEDGPLPSNAQVAGQEGPFLGRLLSRVNVDDLDVAGTPILRDSGGQQIHPFHFLSLGIMAFLGNHHAIVQFDGPRNKHITVAGRFAYVLWRVVYAVKQVDLRSRLLVLLDYVKSEIFGRDISQF